MKHLEALGAAGNEIAIKFRVQRVNIDIIHYIVSVLLEVSFIASNMKYFATYSSFAITTHKEYNSEVQKFV